MRALKLHFSINKKGLLFSKLLQWYQDIEISHVLIEYETPHLGTNVVYHSIFNNGVSFMTIDRFNTKNKITETFNIELEDNLYKEIRNKLILDCGEHYGFLQNIGIVAVDFIKRVFKVKIKNPFKEGKNCSELIYEHLIEGMFGNKHGFDPNIVKPIDIRDILLTEGYVPVYSTIKE